MSDTGSPPTKRRKLNEEALINTDVIDSIRQEEDLQKFSELTTDPIRLQGFADEQQIGIKSFVGDRNDYFKGIIKLRFEDFLVNEVSLEEKVIHLTTYEPIDIPAQQVTKGPSEPREVIDGIIDQEESERFWFLNYF